MAGQIIPKGKGKWLVKVFRGRDPNTGKKKYFSKQVSGNKKDAQSYLNKVLREIDQGSFVDPSPITLDEYLNKWLEAAARPRLAPNTFEHYEDMLKRYVRPALGNHKLSKLTGLDVQSLYSEMLQRGLSARVVRYTHAVLNSALKQAIKWGFIMLNPASLVELPKKERKEMQALTIEQAANFLTVASGDRFYAYFQLAIVTGMRPSECLGLQWKDINFQTGMLTLQRALIWKRDGTWYFGKLKTSKSRRSLPLPQSVLSALKDHRRKQAEERLKIGAKYQNLDLVFTA